MENFERNIRHRAREAFEHRPSELMFSVNGFILSSLKVSSERSEQTQSISIDEKLSFVEVFSEQGVRLLFLDVEPPPDGPIVQASQVKLSDGRMLDLRLSFSDSWPTMQAVYIDPLLKPANAHDVESAAPVVENNGHTAWVEKLRRIHPFSGAGEHMRSMVGTLASGFLLRPATLTGLVAVILIAALLIMRWPTTTVSAAELLRKSAAADEAMAARTDQALRRTTTLEERALGDGKLLTRRKIEIWHSAEKGITARRSFDEANRLVAGEWKKADGSRMIYEQGGHLQAADKQPGLPLSPDKIWLVDPSAKAFTELIGNPESARLEEKASSYEINYQNPAAGDAHGLLKATVVLSKADLHAVEMTVVVPNEETNQQSAIRNLPREITETRAGDKDTSLSHGVNRQWLEYRFTETSLERRASNSVAPAVFEPDPSLLAAAKNEAATKEKETGTAEPLLAASSAPPVASAELEVEVLNSLNRVNALLGEQLSLTRTPEGTLLVSGIVETADRKSEILQSLKSVAGQPAVKIEIGTVAEAQARQKQGLPANITVEEVQVAQQTVPVETELRTYFSGRGLSGDQLEQQIKQLSGQVISHSLRARSHALAIKQIAERFSAADIQAMDPAARAQWRGMISQHAQSFRRELEQVRQELSPVFPNVAATAGGSDIEIKSDEDLARGAKRLFELAASTDVALRRSFSISTAQTTDAPVRGAQFWRAFSSAEILATRIGNQ